MTTQIERTFSKWLPKVVLTGWKLVLAMILMVGGLAGAVGQAWDLADRLLGSPPLIRPENVNVSEDGNFLTLDVTNKGNEPTEIVDVTFKIANTTLAPYKTGPETFVLSNVESRRFEIGSLHFREFHPEMKDERPFTVYVSFSIAVRKKIKTTFIAVAQYDVHSDKFQPLVISRMPKDYMQESKKLPH